MNTPIYFKLNRMKNISLSLGYRLHTKQKLFDETWVTFVTCIYFGFILTIMYSINPTRKHWIVSKKKKRNRKNTEERRCKQESLSNNNTTLANTTTIITHHHWHNHYHHHHHPLPLPPISPTTTATIIKTTNIPITTANSVITNTTKTSSANTAMITNINITTKSSSNEKLRPLLESSRSGSFCYVVYKARNNY